MKSFKHNSGAVVRVDSRGKKTILKHGLKFRSFQEMIRYEKRNKKYFDSSEGRRKYNLEIWLKAKGL